MQVPSRRERRHGMNKNKPKNTSRKLQDFVDDIQENIEVGREIHNEHIRENDVRAREAISITQAIEYKSLMEIHKDEKIVNEILRKKYSK